MDVLSESQELTQSLAEQCEREGIALVPDPDEDDETWEDLLEDEEIAWDPTCKRQYRMSRSPVVPSQSSTAPSPRMPRHARASASCRCCTRHSLHAAHISLSSGACDGCSGAF